MNHSKLTGTSKELTFQIIPSGSIRCNAVVLWHGRSRDAVIVDATDDARPVISFCKRLELRVRQVLLTHGHFEHAADAERTVQEFGCTVSLHRDDHAIFFDIPRLALSFGQTISPRKLTPAPLVDNQTIAALPDFPIMVLHVPGHSEGSVAFYLPEAHWLLTGDTLFHGGIGRTDFPGGNATQLVASIESRIYTLPEQTQVIPGHGPITTVGDEKRRGLNLAEPHIEPTL
jgi:glyoxylase-like metal-dependent hydrolase (beta-lactamase superfamily II)